MAVSAAIFIGVRFAMRPRGYNPGLFAAALALTTAIVPLALLIPQRATAFLRTSGLGTLAHNGLSLDAALLSLPPDFSEWYLSQWPSDWTFAALLFHGVPLAVPALCSLAVVSAILSWIHFRNGAVRFVAATVVAMGFIATLLWVPYAAGWIAGWF
jgi:hypothetical protein